MKGKRKAEWSWEVSPAKRHNLEPTGSRDGPIIPPAVENIIGALGQHKYGKETRTKIQEMTINDGPGGFFAFKEDALWFADQQYGYFCNMLHDQDVPESQRLYLAACRQLFVAQEVSEKYLQRQLGEPLKTAMQDPLLCPSRHVADAIKHALEIGSTLLQKLRLPMKHMAKAKETLLESAAASVRDALRLLYKDEEVSRLMTIRFDRIFTTARINQCADSDDPFEAIWGLFRRALQGSTECLAATSMVPAGATCSRAMAVQIHSIQTALRQLGNFNIEKRSWWSKMFGRPSFPDLAGAIAPAAAWSQDTSWQCLIQLGILGNGTRNIADFQVVTPKHCFLLFINLQREAEAKIEVISHYITHMLPQKPLIF
ncbi:hypothetical protein WJX84_009541 [Apatococcus fuscideae]|uniref:Uncharacterized protein n=1 Tax=Apatococcus fuscideae TaxID=2026836 RepID=A0AAW1SD91_9CHLO